MESELDVITRFESKLALITGDIILDFMIVVLALVTFLLVIRTPVTLKAYLLSRKLKDIRYNSFSYPSDQSKRLEAKKHALESLGFEILSTRKSVQDDPLLKPIFWLLNYESMWRTYDFYQKLKRKYANR